MMLMEAMPGAVELAAWLGSAAFVVGLVNGALKLTDRVKGKPPNETLQVNTDGLAQRVERVETAQRRVDEEVERRAQALYGHIDNLRREFKADIAAVHNRTNEVLQAVSELRGRLNAEG